MKVGWTVQAIFQIELSQIDLDLLKSIKSFFGVGNILERKINGQQSIKYRIQSVKDLKVILDHIDKYPLISQKRADYELFKQAVELMEQKEHLTSEGLAKIVALKASMNMGLSVRSELKAVFPKIIPIARPLVQNLSIPDPQWVAGFVNGEGCFHVSVYKSKTTILGEAVKLILTITQHSRDIAIVQSLTKFLDCGNVTVRSNKLACDFQINKFTDLTDKIIPFFDKYNLQGVKSKDFSDFGIYIELMRSKTHLTAEGLDQIRKIKSGMNRGRQ